MTPSTKRFIKLLNILLSNGRRTSRAYEICIRCKNIENELNEYYRVDFLYAIAAHVFFWVLLVTWEANWINHISNTGAKAIAGKTCIANFYILRFAKTSWCWSYWDIMIYFERMFLCKFTWCYWVLILFCKCPAIQYMYSIIFQDGFFSLSETFFMCYYTKFLI